MPVENGVPADQPGATWRKSKAGNPSGSCIEAAMLPDGEIVVRNSRHPSRAALIYTRAEIAAFLAGAKADESDDLGQHRIGHQDAGRSSYDRCTSLSDADACDAVGGWGAAH